MISCNAKSPITTLPTAKLQMQTGRASSMTSSHAPKLFEYFDPARELTSLQVVHRWTANLAVTLVEQGFANFIRDDFATDKVSAGCGPSQLTPIFWRTCQQYRRRETSRSHEIASKSCWWSEEGCYCQGAVFLLSRAEAIAITVVCTETRTSTVQ